MDLPYWAWGAIVGALGGAGGGLLGWLLQRAGIPAGRWLSVVGIAVGVGFVQTPAFRSLLDQLIWSDARTESALMKVAPDVYSFLKSAFPDDYKVFIGESTQAIRAGGRKGDVALRSAQIMQTLRQKYAGFIRFAPDSELAGLMAEQAAFYERLLGDDPAICSKVAVNGPMSLVGTSFVERHGLAMMPQVLALFRTARAGIDTPQARREPTDADWEVIGMAMAAGGATEEHFQAFAELDANNLATCPAVVLFLKTVNQAESEAARIIRAAYLAETAAI